MGMMATDGAVVKLSTCPPCLRNVCKSSIYESNSLSHAISEVSMCANLWGGVDAQGALVVYPCI